MPAGARGGGGGGCRVALCATGAECGAEGRAAARIGARRHGDHRGACAAVVSIRPHAARRLGARLGVRHAAQRARALRQRAAVAPTPWRGVRLRATVGQRAGAQQRADRGHALGRHIRATGYGRRWSLGQEGGAEARQRTAGRCGGGAGDRLDPPLGHDRHDRQPLADHGRTTRPTARRLHPAHA